MSAAARLSLDEPTTSLTLPLVPGPVLTGIGLVHLQAGHRSKARAALERALAVDPSFAQARQQLRLLERGG